MRRQTQPSLDSLDHAEARMWWEEESLALLNHDLRNALGSIASALQVLSHEGYLSPLAEQAGKTIERQVEQLTHLADQLSGLAGVPNKRDDARRPTLTDELDQMPTRKILVVDDNKDAADSAGMLLALWGHQVKVAYDGPSAIAVARDYQPELCLIDLGMPGMDGFAVAGALRQESALRDARLVAMTGFDREVERKSSRDAGFDNFLVKPVEVTALRAILAEDRTSQPSKSFV
jgi:CheY-like chemotaxis protein